MDIPVPVELWIPDQDWLESTEMTVGQSECPEAADVSELHGQNEKIVRFMCSLRSYSSTRTQLDAVSNTHSSYIHAHIL